MTKTSRTQIKNGMLKIAKLKDPRVIGKALVGNLKGLWRYRIGNYRVFVKLKTKN